MASFPHSFSDKTPKIDRETVLCRICGKPVSLSDARTDADGKAIHEDCYALKIKFEQASGAGTYDQHARGRSLLRKSQMNATPRKWQSWFPNSTGQWMSRASGNHRVSRRNKGTGVSPISLRSSGREQ